MYWVMLLMWVNEKERKKVPLTVTIIWMDLCLMYTYRRRKKTNQVLLSATSSSSSSYHTIKIWRDGRESGQCFCKVYQWKLLFRCALLRTKYSTTRQTILHDIQKLRDCVQETILLSTSRAKFYLHFDWTVVPNHIGVSLCFAIKVILPIWSSFATLIFKLVLKVCCKSNINNNPPSKIKKWKMLVCYCV